MSEFVRHEVCPYCHSRDNLARYNDGHGYCFGCHYSEPATERWLGHKPVLKPLSTLRPLPDDAKPQIGAVGWTWLKKYDIQESETKDMLWSDEKQWLIFTFIEPDGNLTCWQARNFNKERPKPKYITYGPRNEVFCLYGQGDTVVLTEDVISAIKVGRSEGVVGVPLLGSGVPLRLLTRLFKRFSSKVVLGVWLDADKGRESVVARSRASQYFPFVFNILTPNDPKSYSDQEIDDIIQSHRSST